MYKTRGQKRRFMMDEDENGGSGSASSQRPRGLRGKQIGLWYAARGRQRRNNHSLQLTNEERELRYAARRQRRYNLSLQLTDEERELRARLRQIKYEKKNKERNEESIATILLSEKKKNNITKLLQETDSVYPSLADSNSYEHLEETNFKHEFLQHIHGSILEKLQTTTYTSLNLRNEILDDLYMEELINKKQSAGYKKMLECRNRLPSMKMKNEILNLIDKNQIVVLSGETGCGKTTQVAQFILDSYIEQGKGSECKIICTQPRRISAISIAERVAQERDERLGISVGFQIRMEQKIPRSRGSILYCTTGCLGKYMESDPALSTVSHVILDEIHERDVISDFLMTVLKDVMKYRKNIKLILMSATLNAESFSRYYNNAPHINIPGFTFPVIDYYLEDVLQKTKYKFYNMEKKGGYKKSKSNDFQNFIQPHIRQLEATKAYDRNVLAELLNPISEKLNLDLIYVLLKYICRQADDGSVLIFLPGFFNIQDLCKRIKTKGDFPESKYIVIPLHSQLSTVDQKQIFFPAPRGKRKIIVSTQIAETSITIDDVTTVIDCGYIKIGNLDPVTGIETLNEEWVTCANAAQRRGRAGRVKPGVCYHLFSKGRELLLEKFLKPEVLRKSLADVTLQLKMLQLGKAGPFLAKLMDPPESRFVVAAVDLLKRLGALDDNEHLTPLGLHMAKLPVGAQCSKMLIMGALFSCLDPILSVAASLGFKTAFRISMTDEKEAEIRRVELSQDTNSDHLLMHYAIRGLEEASSPWAFCKKYDLSDPILRTLKDIRTQFATKLFDMKFIYDKNGRHPSNNVNSDNLSLVKAVIASGLYPNIGILSNAKIKCFRGPTHKFMKLHPKSILCHIPASAPILVYHVRVKSKGVYIHDGTYVFPLSIIFFGDQFKRESNGQVNDGVSISGTMRFKCSTTTATIIEKLRKRLNQVLEHKVSNPGYVNWDRDTPEVKVLRAIMEMITSEDLEDLALSDFDDNDDTN